MKINISGCSFGENSNVVMIKGDNNVVVNGRILSGNSKRQLRRVDEKKLVDAEGIEKITIDSSVFDINLYVSKDSSKIQAHCYGEVNIDGDVELQTYVAKDEVKIEVIMNGNCYAGQLKFEVIIPDKTFKRIRTKSICANVKIEEDVSAQTIEAETTSGNIDTQATFSNASLETISGNISCYIDATGDIRAKFSSVSGNVLLELANLKKVNLSARSVSGNVQNLYREEDGYSAEVKVTTVSGDVRIK